MIGSAVRNFPYKTLESIVALYSSLKRHVDYSVQFSVHIIKRTKRHTWETPEKGTKINTGNKKQVIWGKTKGAEPILFTDAKAPGSLHRKFWDTHTKMILSILLHRSKSNGILHQETMGQGLNRRKESLFGGRIYFLINSHRTMEKVACYCHKYQNHIRSQEETRCSFPICSIPLTKRYRCTGR